jgi:hypothetical protein
VKKKTNKDNWITTYRKAFALIDMNESQISKKHIDILLEEGYFEKSIAYSVWKSQDKLNQFKGDPRFWTILMNEVRKHGMKNKTKTF